MNNQPVGDRAPHDDLALNHMWARDNGYIPSGNPAPEHRFDWWRHGNPEQWIDVRWPADQIAKHHEHYVTDSRIKARLAELDRVDPIWGDLLGGQV